MKRVDLRAPSDEVSSESNCRARLSNRPLCVVWQQKVRLHLGKVQDSILFNWQVERKKKEAQP